jgi:glycosyltransferase involved in cell wall biosynthesis
MADAPVVSVLMLAYNHERYVADAVESVLEQRDVRLELLVGDDASTDGTGQILQRYADEYPDVVRLLRRPVNLGMFANLADIWLRARGRYIAMLEADDYWSHPLKLATQTAAMDDNPDWVMSFHRVKVRHGDAEPIGRPAGRTAGPYDWSHLARENFAHTCSVIYRSGVVPELPAWLEDLALLDWPLNLLHCLRGGTGFLDEEWAVYRRHGTGVWSPRSRVDRLLQSADMLDRLIIHAQLTTRARVDLERSRSLLLHRAASALAREGRVWEARRAFRSSLSDPLDMSRLRSRLRTLARLYAPPRSTGVR